MTAFLTVPESALTQPQRDALALAPEKWRRMPGFVAGVVEDLVRCGLVETDCRWQWSRVESGAGRYVTSWRRVPREGSA